MLNFNGLEIAKFSSYSLLFGHSVKEIEAGLSRGIYMWPKNDVIKLFYVSKTLF